jgi:hypothetical protein
MKLTEKGEQAWDAIKVLQVSEPLSAKEFSKIVGFDIASATLTSLANKGLLIKQDTKPVSYLINLENELDVESVTTTQKVDGSVISRLFALSSTIESEIDAIFHWMNSDTYASEPGTQIGIYGIRDIVSGDIIYVGKTERPFEQRWSEHKELLKSESHHSIKLQNYFNSLDKDFTKIKFEILQELPKDFDLIDKRERYWIEKYDSSILNHMKPKLVK